MKSLLMAVSIIGLFSTTQLAYSESITDTYTAGDTLSVSTLDNIKSAVNDNDSRVTALEAALAAYTTVDATPPTATDDINSGFSTGSVWVDETADQAYILVDSAQGAAVWKRITSTFYALGETGPAGGVVFYVTEGGLHGLEAAPTDRPAQPGWGCQATVTGADETAIGSGLRNTADILANCGQQTAALETSNFTLNGFNDWFLPSKDELNLLFEQKATIGGFTIGDYWSSSEADGTSASIQNFDTGAQINVGKDFANIYITRPVRAF